MNNKILKVSLDEITEKIIDGLHNLPKEIIEESPYPILSAKNIENGSLNYETKKYVSASTFEKENRRTETQEGDILLTIVGAIGRSIVLNEPVQALFQRSICIIRPKSELVNSAFLNYILSSPTYQNKLYKQSHGAAQKGIYLNKLKKLEIFLPSLEIQEQIVETLDKLTEIRDNLLFSFERECARIEQFSQSILRNIMKDFELNNIQKKPLKEISDIQAGKRITKAMMDESFKYPVMGGGFKPTGYYSDYNFENAITISRAGSAGSVNWVEDKFWATDVCFLVSETEKKYEIDLKFLYYYILFKEPILKTKIYGGNLPKLKKDFLWNLEIPIININEQLKIVNYLDTINLIKGKLLKLLKSQKENIENLYSYAFNQLLNLGDEK